MPVPNLSPRRVAFSLVVLVLLMTSKFFYMASMNTYYTFYLLHHFHLELAHAQTLLFVFLASVAVGTFIGGPIGDRLGRHRVILVSILGVLPFTLVLPFANLFWTIVLTVPIGLILASAFPAILVYAQELLPGKVGTISGLFFGFAFGMGGVGAATLGLVADATSVETVFAICAFLPMMGLLSVFLPKLR
jgi:FSR family fosmidomycin resistance protein-like MFS transporter